LRCGHIASIKVRVISAIMGRTIPSFRTVLDMEKEEWKPFRNALDKKDRKKFDEMWDIPRLYVSACSNSCQLVPLHPISSYRFCFIITKSSRNVFLN
jgi:hypothetical protein